MGVEQAGPTTDEQTAFAELLAKKQRISVRRVGDEDYLHVDVEMDEYAEELNLQDDFTDGYFGGDGKNQTNDLRQDESGLW